MTLNGVGVDVTHQWALTPEQHQFTAWVRDVAASTLAPLAADVEHGHVNRPLVKAMGELGLLTRLFPGVGDPGGVGREAAAPGRDWRTLLRGVGGGRESRWNRVRSWLGGWRLRYRRLYRSRHGRRNRTGAGGDDMNVHAPVQFLRIVAQIV